MLGMVEIHKAAFDSELLESGGSHAAARRWDEP
jgi:hypothetical protein